MENKKYIQWGLVITITTGVGFFLLTIIGNIFVNEITKDVTITTERQSVSSIDFGKKAPNFMLPDLAQGVVEVSDFIGKSLVLVFWTTWNPLAVDQINFFDKYLAKDEDKLFVVLAINNQEERSIVANFMKRGGYSVRVLLDRSGVVGELYSIQTLPTTYFIDKDGIMRDIVIGPLNKELFIEKLQTVIR